jgi:hypothetical protein
MCGDCNTIATDRDKIRTMFPPQQDGAESRRQTWQKGGGTNNLI